MQKDMHFWGVYALARAAGIKAEIARTIAHASQFVDDAIVGKQVVVDQQKAILPVVSSHMPTDYKNASIVDQWQVWVPFHFLPGNQGNSFDERMICQPDSEVANKMKKLIFEKLDTQHLLHLMGILAHAYADTFSHWGFIGLEHGFNQVDQDALKISDKHSSNIGEYVMDKVDQLRARFKGAFAEIVPLGHGPAETLPDRPYLEWQFAYTNRPKFGVQTRNNFEYFCDGCRCLHQLFIDFVKINPEVAQEEAPKKWDDIASVVKDILLIEDKMESRIKQWRTKLAQGSFCTVTNDDKNIDYNESEWLLTSEKGSYSIEALQAHDAYLFAKAALDYKDMLFRNVFPLVGLLI